MSVLSQRPIISIRMWGCKRSFRLEKAQIRAAPASAATAPTERCARLARRMQCRRGGVASRRRSHARTVLRSLPAAHATRADASVRAPARCLEWQYTEAALTGAARAAPREDHRTNCEGEGAGLVSEAAATGVLRDASCKPFAPVAFRARRPRPSRTRPSRMYVRACAQTGPGCAIRGCARAGSAGHDAMQRPSLPLPCVTS